MKGWKKRFHENSYQERAGLAILRQKRLSQKLVRGKEGLNMKAG